MKCNVGKTDQSLRMIAGVGMIALGLAVQSWWGALGIIPLFTGIVRWCPAYVPLKISTNKGQL